jgi:hypothetical protein
MDSSGIKVTSSRIKTMVKSRGIKGGMTLDTDIFATPLPTNSSVPTGGVQTPIHRFNTIMIPKCTGCIPNSMTTGRKMGVKIKIAGVMSIKVPTMSKIKLMMINMATGLLTLSNRKVVIN